MQFIRKKEFFKMMAQMNNQIMKKLLLSTFLPIYMMPMQQADLTDQQRLQEQNEFAQALYNLDIEKVVLLLQQGAPVDRFIRIRGSIQKVRVDSEASFYKYTQSTPIEFVWYVSRNPDENIKKTIVELLLQFGVDANGAWRNSELIAVVGRCDDALIIPWLISIGAKDPEQVALASIKRRLPRDPDTYENIVKQLGSI